MPPYLVLTPLIAGLLMATLGLAFYELADLGGKPLEFELDEPTRARTQVRESVARWIWAITDLAFLSVALAVFTTCAFLATRDGIDRARRDGAFRLVMVAGIVLPALWATYQQADDDRVHLVPAWDRLFDHAFGYAAIEPAHWLLNFGNALGLLTTVALLLGVAVALRAYARSTAGARVALARTMRRMWVYLYLGTGFLICSVIEIQALHRWPAALVVAGADREAIHSLAVTIGGAFGVLYSLLLAGAIVPVTAYLHGRAAALARAEVGDDPELVRGWMKEYGFATSWLPGIGRIAALLGPALAGLPLGELLSKLG